MISRFKYDKNGVKEEKEVLVLSVSEESLFGIDLDKYPEVKRNEIKDYLRKAATLLRTEKNTFRHYKLSKISDKVEAELYLPYEKKKPQPTN